MTKAEIKKLLDSKNIEAKIDRIINNGDAQPLKDMILFAEYLEQKHNRGYVVYWTTAGVPRFEVSNVEEYYESCHYSWIGEVQWHTDLAYAAVTT